MACCGDVPTMETLAAVSILREHIPALKIRVVNVVVAGKQPAPQWLTMDQAVKHCTAGLGIWEWASNDKGGEPDVVMACCGDVPTLETLAAVDLIRKHLPELKVRVINLSLIHI